MVTAEIITKFKQTNDLNFISINNKITDSRYTIDRIRQSFKNGYKLLPD